MANNVDRLLIFNTDMIVNLTMKTGYTVTPVSVTITARWRMS
jgi:hypothetical protein